MLYNPLRLIIAVTLMITFFSVNPADANEQAAKIPGWLQRHVGTGEGQIALIVLQRARALYQRKVREGVVSNTCYLAKDATRPNSIGGKPGRRFFVICEAQKSFRAISSGHGNGRKLQRANFRNDRQCAKHFSNTEGSNLTAGGSYLTAEIRDSFKGYHDQSGTRTPFIRQFLIFDGQGETANARLRDIGGHQAVFLRARCRYLDPASPHADDQGYVPFGRLVNYTGGRSNGCTTWSPADARDVISLVEGNPTTLYIYPESDDIDAVVTALAEKGALSRTDSYWNEACLKAIGSPQFWSKDSLQPIINDWRQSLPRRAPKALPICN